MTNKSLYSLDQVQQPMSGVESPQDTERVKDAEDVNRAASGGGGGGSPGDSLSDYSSSDDT